MDWREHWEQDAQAEYEAFCASSLDTLLDRVAGMRLGSHYMIWPAIAAKGNLQRAGWPLYRFTRSGAPYLHRYHCAAALLTLLGTTEYAPSQLTVEHLNPGPWLDEVAKVLESRIGPPDRAA